VNWDNSQLKSATILSLRGNVCRLRAPRPVQVKSNGHVVEVQEVDGTHEFQTVAGARYEII
jgi:alpha-L-fucosidase 2